MSKDDEVVIMRGARHVVTDCGVCGVVYTVPERRYDHMRSDGGFASCPNGHQWGWREGTKQRDELRLERDRLKQQIAEKDDAILEARRERDRANAKALRIEKRSKAGVCPCCNRSFKQLREHMKKKHPEQASATNH